MKSWSPPLHWEDQAIVLGLGPLGETKKIVTVLTRCHGRHKGVWRPVKGGALGAGCSVKAAWRGRLADQLGTWAFEVDHQSLAYFLAAADLLMALHSAVALCDLLLPEREPAAPVFEAFNYFLMARTLKAYCYFELALLNQTSFPLDLQRCALGGLLTEPAYVSPKTGRAVSASAAKAYIPKLLPLPFFMRDKAIDPSVADIIAALALTGYFLERYSLDNQKRTLPLLRHRLLHYLQEKSGRKQAL